MPPRRGLVLEGGGAKGAYAYGCLLAFREHGIRFDAVAGTSVGALNGLLWATDSLDQERSTWEHLSQDLIYPRRRSHIGSLIVVFYQVYAGFLRHLQHTAIHAWGVAALWLGYAASTALLWLMLTLAAAPFLAAAAATEEATPAHVLLIVYLVLSFLCVMDVMERNPVGKLLAGAVTCVIVLARIALGEPLSLLWLTLPAVLVAIFYAGYLQLSEESSLDSSPLGQLVRRTLDRGVTIPLYVTLAQETDLYDPDRPRWRHHKGRRLETFSLEPDRRFVATYFPVHDAPADEGAAAVVASAALPFGFAPHVTLNGARYVDGGVVDNCPIFPIAVLAECQEIVVIRLSPARGPDTQALLDGFREIDRTQRVRTFEPRRTFWDFPRPARWKAPYTVNDPPVVVPYRELPARPLTIHTIGPSRKLGGLFSGTLNFSAPFAQTLIRQGYDDASAFLARTPMPAAAPTSVA